MVFSVAVAGTPQLSYQWRVKGNSLAGKTTPTLVLPAVQLSDVGQYSVTIANSLGTATSSDAALTVTPPSPCVPAPSGLVAWWAAENNALDWAGTNHGATVGGVGFAPGRVGTAFTIPNDYSGVGIGHPDGLQVQDFTIEAWIKRADLSLVSFGYGEDSLFLSCGWHGYGFSLASSGQPFLSKIGADALAPSVAISDTAWHHVALTKSGSTVIFYVDGVAHPTDPYETIFDLGSDMSIGARGGDFWNAFNGLIDELSFYSRPLADTEIQAIYAAGRTGKCPDADGSGMPSWWQLKYFGEHVDAGLDFDGDRYSNLQEYQNGTDPNSIRFTAHFANDHFNSTLVGATLEVLAGLPSQMAILVNDTNLASANWIPYSSSVNLALGPADGTYAATIGLRGLAEDSEQTWCLIVPRRSFLLPARPQPPPPVL